jgi:hypothetical protein
MVWRHGRREWWLNGKLHRTDRDFVTDLTLPAEIYANGDMAWWRNGQRHRTDKDPVTDLTLPAVDRGNLKVWWLNGKCHRADRDPITGLVLPAEVWVGGDSKWFINGQLRRDDKDPKTGLSLPAYLSPDRDFIQWSNGLYHRENGPAVLWTQFRTILYYWEGAEVNREVIVQRVTTVPWVVWANRGAHQTRRLPRAILDEIVGFATPQMAKAPVKAELSA